MPGRGSSSGFFAFTARSVQTTKEPPPNERREAIYYPQLSENGPRRCPEALLSDRISRNANRSCLRRSTIVCGLSHDLLHRLGNGIVLRGRDRRTDTRLSAWIAQAYSESALIILDTHFALSG